MSAGQTREGPGYVAWWGFSPARDLLTAGPERQQGEVNVLLVGAADPRHILKTVGGLRDADSLRVWALESSMEVVARQLLLLYLALIPKESMGLREKAEMFLEVFGNAEIRGHTEETLRRVASQLTLSVADAAPEAATHSCLDVTRLKYKERDELVAIFKRWIQPPPSSSSSSSSACGHSGAPFSMTEAWDGRVRRYLGKRYDSRTGSFDWDLSMKLHKRGCGVVDKRQYDRWREKGLAFEMREGVYQIANPTLLSTRVFSNHKGDKVASRGYWGDIVSSPYLSFGIETDDESLLAKRDGRHVKTAQDISLANVQTLFRSLSRRGSQPATSHQPDSGEKEAHHKAIDIQDLLRVNGVSVTFLPLGSLSKLPGKPEYTRFFDTIYFSAGAAHQLEDPALRRIAAPGAVLVVELTDYLLDLTQEQVAGYAERVADMAKDAGFAPTRREGERKDIHAVFTLQAE